MSKVNVVITTIQQILWEIATNILLRNLHDLSKKNAAEFILQEKL